MLRRLGRHMNVFYMIYLGRVSAVTETAKKIDRYQSIYPVDT